MSEFITYGVLANEKEECVDDFSNTYEFDNFDDAQEQCIYLSAFGVIEKVWYDSEDYGKGLKPDDKEIVWVR